MLSSVILVALVGFATAADSEAPVSGEAIGDYVCPEWWTRFGSNCYKFYHTTMTWYEARRTCQEVKGELVSIHGDLENTELFNYWDSIGGSGNYWIGLNDIASEGNFLWSDGTALDYTKFSSGNPSTVSGNDEDCVMVDNAGSSPDSRSQWLDYPCHYTWEFFCKLSK